MVEQFLGKEEVAGSNPAGGTKQSGEIQTLANSPKFWI